MDAKAKVSISNEKDITLDDIIKEGDNIYKECKKVKKGLKRIEDCGKDIPDRKAGECKVILDTDFDKIDELHNKIYTLHKDFASSYPMVLRHITQQQQYSTKAFKNYLLYLGKNPWKNDNERIESYGVYYKYMMRELTPRYDTNKLNAEVNGYVDKLKKEHKDFMKLCDECTKKVESDEKRFKRERMLDLYKLLEREKDV